MAEQLGGAAGKCMITRDARLPGKLRDFESSAVLRSVCMSFVCARQLRSSCRQTIFLSQLVSFDDIIAFSTRINGINRCLTRIHGGDDGT